MTQPRQATPRGEVRQSRMAIRAERSVTGRARCPRHGRASHSDGGTSGRRYQALGRVSQFGHGESAVQLQARAPPQERFYRRHNAQSLSARPRPCRRDCRSGPATLHWRQDNMLETVAQLTWIPTVPETTMSGFRASSRSAASCPRCRRQFPAVVVGVHHEQAAAAELGEDRGLPHARHPSHQDPWTWPWKLVAPFTGRRGRPRLQPEGGEVFLPVPGVHRRTPTEGRAAADASVAGRV